MEATQKKLFAFIDTHIKDLKRLLFETDMALMSMVLLKLNKKMDTSEAKIKSTQAKIPFGLYTSPGQYIRFRYRKYFGLLTPNSIYGPISQNGHF